MDCSALDGEEHIGDVPLKQLTVFKLEGFHIPPGYGSPLFVLALLDCMVTPLGNAMVACVIVIDKSLHRPMFAMVCNPMACDLLGAMAVLPSLMRHSVDVKLQS